MIKVFNNIKILVILPSLNKAGGIENSYMNYYQYFSDKIKIDFITFENNSEEFRNKINLKNDKLFVLEKFSGKRYFKFKKDIKLFFQKHHDYNIIHCHMANGAYFFFKEAKKYNIDVRIIHGHLTRYADIKLHAIRNFFLVKLGLKYATNFLSCGKEAGDFLFKNKEYLIINNAIDFNKFIFNNDIRKKIRNEYLIPENTIVLGNIGRFVPAKNQNFLLDIVDALKKKKIDVKLFLIGNGALENDIKKRIKELNITNDVIIVDSTTMPEYYYQAFDFFLMPSISEGLPVAGIEAQVSGLKCIFSKSITKEVKISKNVYFCDIDTPTEWLNIIINNFTTKNNRINQISFDIEKKFNVKYQVEFLEEYYDKCLNGKDR